MAENKPGSFVHIEIASTDPQKTRQFFEDVFGWEFEFMPEMNYHTYVAPSGPGGGLMTPMENQSPGILSYLMSQDIDKDVKKIEGAGGRVLQPKREIPGVGWWALFQEPTGIVLALFQGVQRPPERRERARPPARRSVSRKGTKAKKASRARGRSR
jgi:predicted enzyme related to lactoylglutathione lyase